MSRNAALSRALRQHSSAIGGSRGACTLLCYSHGKGWAGASYGDPVVHLLAPSAALAPASRPSASPCAAGTSRPTCTVPQTTSQAPSSVPARLRPGFRA